MACSKLKDFDFYERLGTVWDPETIADLLRGIDANQHVKSEKKRGPSSSLRRS
jgi:hypothetical protein